MTQQTTTPQPPQPVDIVEGIPDRAATSSRHRLLWVLVIFALWIAVLLYMLLGTLPKGVQ